MRHNVLTHFSKDMEWGLNVDAPSMMGPLRIVKSIRASIIIVWRKIKTIRRLISMGRRIFKYYVWLNGIEWIMCFWLCSLINGEDLDGGVGNVN